ncbi:hypothetical protein ACFQX4_23570 [Roseomonas sp. GCM10028921]
MRQASAMVASEEVTTGRCLSDLCDQGFLGAAQQLPGSPAAEQIERPYDVALCC